MFVQSNVRGNELCSELKSDGLKVGLMCADKTKHERMCQSDLTLKTAGNDSG